MYAQVEGLRFLVKTVPRSSFPPYIKSCHAPQGNIWTQPCSVQDLARSALDHSSPCHPTGPLSPSDVEFIARSRADQACRLQCPFVENSVFLSLGKPSLHFQTQVNFGRGCSVGGWVE